MKKTIFLTPKEVANKLNVSPKSIHRILNKGDIPFILIGSRKYIQELDLEKYIKEQSSNTHNS